MVGTGEEIEQVMFLSNRGGAAASSSTLTFNTSDVSNQFIIHLTQHPADSQHIQQRSNNILSSFL